MVYLDNAATSFPKPESVARAMYEYMTENGVNVNRGVYSAAHDAEERLLTLRERLCRLFGLSDPRYALVTPGATVSLNTAIKGCLRSGDHCIVGSLEHNAVMRPLTQLLSQGISFDRIPADREGRTNPEDILPLIRQNTRLLVMSHASNVCGTLADARAIGQICSAHGISFVLDASQTAGHFPISFSEMGLSALAASGHKGLFGPPGTGILLMEKHFAASLEPLISGGTGSASDSEEPPQYMPDRFEAGTPNLPGIYGLENALMLLENETVEAIYKKEQRMTALLLEGFSDIEGIRLVGLRGEEGRMGVVSVDFMGMDNALAARLLAERGIFPRCGLHCAPAAHKTLGTFPRGTVRFSVGRGTTESDIAGAVAAVSEICR